MPCIRAHKVEARLFNQTDKVTCVIDICLIPCVDRDPSAVAPLLNGTRHTIRTTALAYVASGTSAWTQLALKYADGLVKVRWVESFKVGVFVHGHILGAKQSFC